MGIFQFLKGDSTKVKVPRIDLELTRACNHRCAHCYNVWNAPGEDPAGDPKEALPTDRYLEMMDRLVEHSGVTQITITGGEPLLRPDAPQIIRHASELVDTVQVISNGSRLDRQTAALFGELGVHSVQLTFLAATPEKHDRLKGYEGSFEQTVRAALDLRDEGVAVQVCFVALGTNCDELQEVLELCLALNVKTLAYNRMSPAGAAIEQVAGLMPTVEQVEANLRTADALGRKWKIRVATAMPIPPCLIRLERYSWVEYGFCSTGTHSPNLVVDPCGDLRPCNLSSQVVGNVLKKNWGRMMRHRYLKRFNRALPEVCRGCTHEATCRGGCKESALATYGSLEHPEPFLQRALDQEP